MSENNETETMKVAPRAKREPSAAKQNLPKLIEDKFVYKEDNHIGLLALANAGTDNELSLFIPLSKLSGLTTNMADNLYERTVYGPMKREASPETVKETIAKMVANGKITEEELMEAIRRECGIQTDSNNRPISA